MKNIPYVGYMHITVKKIEGIVPILIYVEENKIKEYMTNITVGMINEFDNLDCFDTKIDGIKIIIRKTNNGNWVVATDEIIESYKEINNNSDHFYNKLSKLSLDKTKCL